MIQKFRKSISLLLVLVFFLPTIVKLEHHHEHAECRAHHHAAQYQEFHGKCAVCEFEFSFFLAGPIEPVFREAQPAAGFFNHYESLHLSNLSAYSFQLRGPPPPVHRV